VEVYSCRGLEIRFSFVKLEPELHLDLNLTHTEVSNSKPSDSDLACP
jgi:hypothetical protein